MSEVNQRLASFVRTFSMLLVIASLLYMYAYIPESGMSTESAGHWISNLPKSQIFYIGLGFFLVVNLMMNLVISRYNNASDIDPKSLLFRSVKQKKKLLIWLNYFLGGINTLISSTILFLALSKINEVSDYSEYIFLLLIGMVILIGILIGLIRVVIQKS